jgi:hypothetical protein
MEKVAAHDKWVCLPCRWTAKLPFPDARAPERPRPRCPSCKAELRFAGNAFRPPRKTDEEGWMERLFAAGVHFPATRERRRLPRTLRELDDWVAERERPDAWCAERRVRLQRGSRGVVVRCGERELAHGERLLLWHDGDWLEGKLGLRGDGRIALRNPVVRLTRRRRVVLLTAGARLRLPPQAGRVTPPKEQRGWRRRQPLDFSDGR